MTPSYIFVFSYKYWDIINYGGPLISYKALGSVPQHVSAIVGRFIMNKPLRGLANNFDDQRSE